MNFTDLPAGITAWFLFSMNLIGASYMVTVGYWLGKGARIGLPLDQEGSFLQVKRWKELRTEMIEMFLMKHFSFTFFSQNLCSKCKFLLFSLEICPVCEPTSKGTTQVW